MKISVVIPTHNREDYLPRAIESVINQTSNEILEIIIVDDASTDSTKSLVEKYQTNYEISIKYMKNNKSLGGAVARNQGAKEAKGEYIAFLDSDDEWHPNHIESSLEVLHRKNAKATYSNFIVSSNNIEKNRQLIKKEKNIRMGDYLLSNNGDTRTSTFLFIKEYFNRVRFDENLKKHQDWDIAIRFDEEFNMVLNPQPTVIIHKDVNNRMSLSNNHGASKIFIQKHYDRLASTSIANFFTNLAIVELRINGKNEKFKKYLKTAKKHSSLRDIKINIKLLSISIPFLNFFKIYDYLVEKNVL